MGYLDKETYSYTNYRGAWTICRMTDLDPHVNGPAKVYDAASYRFAIYAAADYERALNRQKVPVEDVRYVAVVFSGKYIRHNETETSLSLLDLAKVTVSSMLDRGWSENEYWYTTDSVGSNDPANIIVKLKNGTFEPDRKMINNYNGSEAL